MYSIQQLDIDAVSVLHAKGSQLRGGIRRDVAADHEEAAHQDVFLRQELQGRQVAGAEAREVGHHDRENLASPSL